MSAAHLYNPHQLSVLIETLAHEAINKKSNVAVVKLKSLYSELNNCFDFSIRGNFEKIRVILVFLEENYAQAQEIIRTSYFEDHHHSFLREIYKGSELYLTGDSKSLLSNSEPLIFYPANIEKKDHDGIPMSIAKYIKDYYIRQKFAKKAVNVKKIAETTKLSEEIVSRRLQYHREQMSSRLVGEQATSKFKKQKTRNVAEPHLLQNNYYAFSNDYMFPYLPSPPMTEHDMFPTHRIPLDQPLTIIIPN